MSICCVSLALLVAIAALVLTWLQRRYSYWERHGVPHNKPVWFYGNMSSVGKTTTMREPFRDVYAKYKGKSPFAGFYFALRHAVVPLDLELVKSIMLSTNFNNRGNYYNEKDDPLSAHLFNLDGADWREMRNKCSPTFTSLKIQQMLPTVLEISERLVALLQQQVNTSAAASADETPIEFKDLLARFNIDVIGSCAFGLDCNSLAEPQVEFRSFGRLMFTKRRHSRMFLGFITAFPRLARFLHIKSVRDDVTAFYTHVVREALAHRQQHKIQRNDLLNLLMTDGKLTFNQIVAQAFVFFLGGFESSSSTMSYALYLLAMHPELQQRARAEVQQVWAKHGQLNYEAIKDLKYTEQVLHETMRMYAVASIITRQAINDFRVPGTSHVIAAGTTVIIPIDAIHNDPDIYPQPEQFDPERFTPEAVQQRHSMAWLPFGAGPRNCIGLRFGEMQSLIGLAMLLKHFRFSAAQETPIPLEFDVRGFLLTSKGGIVLNVDNV